MKRAPTNPRVLVQSAPARLETAKCRQAIRDRQKKRRAKHKPTKNRVSPCAHRAVRWPFAGRHSRHGKPNVTVNYAVMVSLKFLSQKRFRRRPGIRLADLVVVDMVKSDSYIRPSASSRLRSRELWWGESRAVNPQPCGKDEVCFPRNSVGVSSPLLALTNLPSLMILGCHINPKTGVAIALHISVVAIADSRTHKSGKESAWQRCRVYSSADGTAG